MSFIIIMSAFFFVPFYLRLFISCQTAFLNLQGKPLLWINNDSCDFMSEKTPRKNIFLGLKSNLQIFAVSRRNEEVDAYLHFYGR